jgi:UPF0755 protein
MRKKVTLLLRKPLSLYVLAGSGVLLMIFLNWYFFTYRAPHDFPINQAIGIANGASISEIAYGLRRDNVIHSSFWFTTLVLLLEHENNVVSGQYYFDHPLTLLQVIDRVTSGEYNMDQLKTTIPEGSTVAEIAAIVKKNYPSFDDKQFIELATEREGYLFPDTYLFGADVRSEKIVAMLTSTFNTKIQQPEITDKVEQFGKPMKEVITMASILEGEARQTRTRRIVSGILWERLKRDMPLQVDATFKYINGKTTADLTLDDLKIDSPYNTYLYKGLPPTPVSNPGLDSISAAITPIQTRYLYFLTGRDGNMYYAETLEEHAENKRRYLD